MPKPSSPASEKPSMRKPWTDAWQRAVKSRVLWVALGVTLAVFIGYYAGRASIHATGAIESTNGRVKLRPGPWGDVEYLPITIAAPRKLLRVQAIEDEVLQWHFTGMSRADVMLRLVRLGVSETLRGTLVSPSVLTVNPRGVRLAPTCEMVRSLNESALTGLYETLSAFPENNPLRWEFQTKYIGSFEKYGVSRSAVRSLEAVSIHRGKYMVTFAMSCALADMSTQEEKVGVMKALSQQSSMLIRLRLTPKSDVAALADYWGRGLWTTDVEAILESIKMRPDGGSINILELMPPLAGALLHSYPVPHNFLNGPEVVKNCSWTAFNFFRDTPIADYSGEDYVLKALAEDYHPVLSDPRYGDIAVFLTPDRMMRHVAVYLADNVFFTKNGENPWHPWVYSTLEELMESFSFGLPEGQALNVRYFRSKAH
jgi:hypothetical protein